MVKVAQKETDLKTALIMCARQNIPKSPCREAAWYTWMSAVTCSTHSEPAAHTVSLQHTQ